MNKTEIIKMAVLETKLEDHIVQNNKDNKDIKDGIKALDSKFDDLRVKFAGKWVEKGFWTLLAILVTAGIGFMSTI